jgi:BioD-like phosphotransacetylase family protein
MKRIFIAATKQNDGKTTVSLGLIANFKAKFQKVGFIKPIGQRYLEEEGLKIDEDSWLIEEVCGIRCGLKDMSPIAVEKGFTEKYIDRPDKKNISSRIKEAFYRVSKEQDLVIIEGTGHAGVGSVFDHSNAYTAKLLNSKALIISSGGVGRPIDEILLNKALFEKEGVKVLGAIINKVLPQKFEKINRLVRKGLERNGVRVLGVIPYNPMLSYPSIEQIYEEMDFDVLCGNEYLERSVSHIIVGAMQVRDAIRFISEDSLLITPGDRDDIITAALGIYKDLEKEQVTKVSGMILSGGMLPEARTVELLRKSRLPVLLAKADTYTVSSAIHDLNVKMRPCDKEKIKAAIGLIKEHIDFDAIFKGM